MNKSFSARKKFSIKKILLEARSSFSKIIHLDKEIEEAAILMIKVLKNKKKIFFCGNGGSAADSQHIAAELIGRFLKVRKPLAALSLTSNSSIITSIGNDFSFDNIFLRQLQGLGSPGDLLFAISTSGKSKNINKTIKFAIKNKIYVVFLTSIKCKKKMNYPNKIIKAPALRVDRIQEMHICIGHILCEYLENKNF
jgi:D-sedoheptulose 7-phosphate isomerase